MLLNKRLIEESNNNNLAPHRRSYEYIAGGINNAEAIIQKLADFQVAIPSWALGTGGKVWPF